MYNQQQYELKEGIKG